MYRKINIEEILKHYPDYTRPSCPHCGSKSIVIAESNDVSLPNPLGETRSAICCSNCGTMDNTVPERLIKDIARWLVCSARRYICEFMLRGSLCNTESVNGIGDFIDGFWVNEDYELTKGSDAVCWIPPGRIEHIEISTDEKRLG